MALFVCWVLFPVLLLLVVEGCGSLVEWLTGRPLRAGVRLPSGFALVIFALDLPTHSDATATLALPLALALATAGLILTPLGGVGGRIGGWWEVPFSCSPPMGHRSS